MTFGCVTRRDNRGCGADHPTLTAATAHAAVAFGHDRVMILETTETGVRRIGDVCRRCRGRGRLFLPRPTTCPECKGSGLVRA